MWLVGGLEHLFLFFYLSLYIYIGNNDPNWLLFFRGVGIPLTRWFGYAKWGMSEIMAIGQLGNSYELYGWDSGGLHFRRSCPGQPSPYRPVSTEVGPPDWTVKPAKPPCFLVFHQAVFFCGMFLFQKSWKHCDLWGEVLKMAEESKSLGGISQVSMVKATDAG